MRDFGKRSIFLSLVILLSFIFQVSAQENKMFQNLLGNLAVYTNNNSPEKVYVQTDKDFYTNGETIWFKTYLLNGITHKASNKSQVVYVELIDSKDNIIAQQKLYTESAGASGDIILPIDIKEGTYVLRAYTKYMLNDKEPVLFQKEIPIWAQRSISNYVSDKVSNEKKEDKQVSKKEITTSRATKPIVQFFPEGGNLVTGIESVLGVKITDVEGNGLALEGKIFDQDGVLVSLFRSYEFGLGRTSFKVEPNTDYYLQIQIDGEITKYPIPEPLLKGYALRVMNLGEYIKIHVSTNIASGLQGALLVGHLRGDLIFKQFLRSKGEFFFSLKLFTSKMRDGIAHFTLFAPNGAPVSERLTFIESPENTLKLSVKTDKSNYNFRKKVNVDLALVDDRGRPLDGDFSMSVVTQKGLQKDTDNLKSWLLLNSDLGGTIADPNFFFQENLKGRKSLLDLLMLTHGWRRFTWQSFMNIGVRKELAFPPEKGIMISGNTTAFNNRYQPKKTLATLTIMAKKINQEKKPTNARGRFSFGPFFFQDRIATIINAHRIPETKKSKDQVSIYLDPPFPSIKVKNLKKRQINKATTTYAKSYLRKAQHKKMIDFEYSPKTIKLKEVVVKSKIKTRQELINKELNSRTLYGQAQNRLFTDSSPWMQTGSVLDIVRLVPGVKVYGVYPNQSVEIRGQVSFGNGPPLYLLDGMPVPESAVRTMRTFNILFVDVLKGADAAIYGMRSAGGVIAIYTKKGGDLNQNPKRFPGVTNATIPGFYKTREFYKPNYAMTIADHRKPDYRTTLHWAPDIEIKGGESSKLSFYTGDTAGKYTIRVEGITFDGRPVHKLYSFNIVEDSP